MSKSKNWIQKAVNPKHKGRCKNMGSKDCPVGSPQYNLAYGSRLWEEQERNKK